jgi:hypothetical protein
MSPLVASEPAATLTVRGFSLLTWDGASAADFNGDGKWTMNGSTPISYASLPDVGSDWHLV